MQIHHCLIINRCMRACVVSCLVFLCCSSSTAFVPVTYQVPYNTVQGTGNLKVQFQPNTVVDVSKQSVAQIISERYSDNAMTRLYLSSAAGPMDIPYDDNKEQAIGTDERKYNWTKKNMAILLPALVGLLTDPLLSMVDTGYIGRVGAIELAALGACTSIFNMAFTVFRSTTMATTSLVASAKSKDEARHITKISLQLALVMGSMVSLLLRFGGKAMLAGLGVGANSPLLKSSCEYLYTRCWAAPAVLSILVCEGAFRGFGDTKTPLRASAAAAIVNLVLDPLLMFPLGLKVKGAAAATALSQVGAVAIYAYYLIKRGLLPQRRKSPAKQIATGKVGSPSETPVRVGKILRTILGANASTLLKQGSVISFYTVAAGLATRMGYAHVAAHQVCLSFWLVFTIWLDSASVSSQVLMSKAVAERDQGQALSLTKYMVKFGALQGVLSSILLWSLRGIIPVVFTKDPTIRSYCSQLMPHMANQQVLISVMLVLEAMSIGGNQFQFMAVGSAICTVLGMLQLQQASHVVNLWSGGFLVFFSTRFLNGLLGTISAHRSLHRRIQQEKQQEAEALGATI